jgi:hypothetical protein
MCQQQVVFFILVENPLAAMYLVKRHLVKWHFGKMAFWSDGILVRWHFGQMAFWPDGILVKWHFCQMAFWSNGILVKWHFGQMAFGKMTRNIRSTDIW